ncbi:hypothetical protein ISN45_Aa01g030010 [Arabidopsis thaliana x Arabidopsis arenosa]|uniref:Prolamin-like domain-containing protein n=1 Tax=Arabidopsis thaliana x Arabidopsis arenosa TaxID=1240361 RepID=A0A8T2C8X5_9BRAS|nr:hypothetical protein ISN45_Aa01g030010 [Arabidopsis thaliana x Arabidopsis arenosa]
MKSLIFLVPLLCLIISPTTTIASWPKPSEVSNEDMVVNTDHNHYFGNKLNYEDSKVWKCTYNNGSGAAISISYPSPPHPPSPKPPTPSSRPPSPLSPKKSPPPPKPSPPPRTPKKSPPPKPSSPPPTPKKSPPLPKPSSPPPTPKKSPPPPKPSLPPPSPKKSPPPPKQSPSPPKPSSPPPTPKKSPPSPKPSLSPPKPSSPPPSPKRSPPPPKPSPSPSKPSTPPPTAKKSPPPPRPSQPPPKPSPPRRKPSPPIPKPSTSPPTPKISPPSPKPSPPRPIPKKSPPPPTTPAHRYPNPWVHFANCISEFGPSAICKQQMEVSYYRRGFLVSDYCCNLIVNMRHECTDVILGFFTDPFFVPLIRYTCHVNHRIGANSEKTRCDHRNSEFPRKSGGDSAEKFTGPAMGMWICGPLMSLIDTVVIGQGSSIELAALGTLFSHQPITTRAHVSRVKHALTREL